MLEQFEEGKEQSVGAVTVPRTEIPRKKHKKKKKKREERSSLIPGHRFLSQSWRNIGHLPALETPPALSERENVVEEEKKMMETGQKSLIPQRTHQLLPSMRRDKPRRSSKRGSSILPPTSPYEPRRSPSLSPLDQPPTLLLPSALKNRGFGDGPEQLFGPVRERIEHRIETSIGDEVVGSPEPQAIVQISSIDKFKVANKVMNDFAGSNIISLLMTFGITITMYILTTLEYYKVPNPPARRKSSN